MKFGISTFSEDPTQSMKLNKKNSLLLKYKIVLWQIEPLVSAPFLMRVGKHLKKEVSEIKTGSG
jgi:hypothetical protein